MTQPPLQFSLAEIAGARTAGRLAPADDRADTGEAAGRPGRDEADVNPGHFGQGAQVAEIRGEDAITVCGQAHLHGIDRIGLVAAGHAAFRPLAARRNRPLQHEFRRTAGPAAPASVGARSSSSRPATVICAAIVRPSLGLQRPAADERNGESSCDQASAAGECTPTGRSDGHRTGSAIRRRIVPSHPSMATHYHEAACRHLGCRGPNRRIFRRCYGSQDYFG